MKYVASWLLLVIMGSLLAMPAPLVAAASVNNFRISNFEIEYRLARDNKQRSYLDVTERITADFPNYNQNKGLVREVPVRYDGRKVRMELHSTTRNGQPEPIYAQYNQSDHRVIELGTDDYVLGQQVYELRYTLHDVTKYFSNTGRDEFYWDTNGTNWRVPISRLAVKINLEGGLEKAFTGDKACYQGAAESTDRCELSQTNDGAFEVIATGLTRYENVTVALGFAPETFAPHEPALLEVIYQWWLRSLWFTTPLGVLIIITLFTVAYRRTHRVGESKVIVPEYLPPKDASVVVAPDVLASTSSRVVGALLIDLAVRRIISISEVRPKTFWRSAEYELEVMSEVSTLRAEELEIVSDLFTGMPSPGAKLSTKDMRGNRVIGIRLQDNASKLGGLIRGEYKLRARNKQQDGQMRRLAAALLAAGVATLSPAILVAALTALRASSSTWPLTDKGLELRRYLKGLKMYIGVAEVDRLRMLQSPEGAEKVPHTDVNNPAQLVKLYEKVLPYAVLFGQEKQWTKVLGEYYETSDSQPAWYHGSTAFSATSLSQITRGISGAAASSSSASSSSGGSSGGGFSGGGGGGGGGGGR